MDIQTYLLHSSAILALLSIFYWLLLRKETFFKVNRWLLLGNILLAFAIPLLPKPAYVIQLKADLVESFQPAIIESPVVHVPENTSTENTSFSPSNEAIDLGITPIEVADTKPVPIYSINLLNWIYLIGFCIMLFRFLIQIYSVYRQIKRSEVTKGAGYYLATNNKDIAPFSFWKYIVINPNKYDETSFIQILEHERIHIIQRHTYDLVLAELFLIVQWFNPLAWWHRHLIDQNLEFLVDQTLLDNGENKQAYQYHLVQVAVPNSPLSISSNYNASQLKNRIKMMNLQRSSLAASWKYALLLPIAFMLLVAFTNENTITLTEDTTAINEQLTAPESSYIILTPDATKADLQALQEKLYAFNYVLSFEKLVFESGKITALDALLDYNDKMGIKIPIKWEASEATPKVALLINEANGRIGNFQANEIAIKDLATRIPKEQIFIAGNFPLEKVLIQMRQHSVNQKNIQEKAFQKNIKNPNWKGKLTSNSRSYSGAGINESAIKKLKEKIQAQSYPTTYHLDGIESDATVLDIPFEEIALIVTNEFRYRKFDESGKFTHATPWNLEVRVKRRGKNQPAKTETIIKQPEEIYIILTEEASLEEIKKVQEELLEMGVKLSLFSIKYNDTKTKIESIKVLFEADGNSGMVSWNNGNRYNFLVVGKKPGSTFSGEGSSYLQEIKTRKKDSKLFILGKENNKQTISFLEKQVDKNQQLFLAKQKKLANDPNWTGYESTNSHSYINLTTEKIIGLKDKIKQAHPKKLNYYVDGVEWESEALDIPTEKIDDIMWFEKNLTKYDGEGKVKEIVVSQLNIFVNRKVKQEKSKAKKGFQYFKECDCHIPKTFNPDNGNNTFKIEGVKINTNSSFQVYDRWGEKVYDATPFNNDWNGQDDDRTVLKEATYYFKFQAEEGEAIAQGYFKIVGENTTKTLTDFVHQADTIHYVIIPCTAEDFDATKNTIKPSLFMLAAAKKRYSSIYLGSNKNKPLFIIRKFDDFEQAEQFRVNFKNINSKLPNLKLLSISQQNYQTVLRQKSIIEYEKFYKGEILK